MWFLRLEARVKLLPHTGHSNFSPRWIFSCSRRRPDWLKLLSHTEQWYGFSPVCVSRCRFMAPEWAKLFPQSGQEKGFSPVCTLSSPGATNDLSQCVQLYGFSPVCVRMWVVRVHCCENVFPQSEQWYGVMPVWRRSCLTSVPDKQGKGLSPECVRRCR
uniref:Uncharacterized protein n=1 Tax=Gouania willdenowi TaxID=441366 RepID=A0A8C5NEY5_GOUWI